MCPGSGEALILGVEWMIFDFNHNITCVLVLGVEWLVFDFKRTRTLDGINVVYYGDGTHGALPTHLPLGADM